MDTKAYDIKVVLSSKITEQMKMDFCSVCSEAFDTNMSVSDFNKKYIENIFGDSVIVVAYDEEGAPAGARALWRNDVAGKVAYQPCDTCVLKKNRKQGLFEKMTFKALDVVPKDAVIYNYPNDNSRRLYLKLGWKVNVEYKPRFWKGYDSYHDEHPEILIEDYFDWWFGTEKRERYQYLKKGGKYFLVKNRGKYFRMVTAEISETIATNLSPAKGFRILMYWSKNHKRYNRNHESFIVVFRYDSDVKIPIWKMDVV